jgi:ABC-2 type transport system ATP-binding protein
VTTVAVQFEQVSKKYKHFALNSISFQLEEGGIMGFIGVNGAGKSTTIRLLMGLVHQDQGKIEVLGRQMPEQQRQAKWDIGFVSDDLRLYRNATLAWHIDFVRSIYPNWDNNYAQQLLQRFDLKAAHGIKGLSHGQRVKAALLLALARRPRLLVLDEPTTGLDPVARHEVLAELMQVLHDERRTVFFSSHNTLDIEQISDQITFIDQGSIIDSSDKESFLERWRRLRLEVPAGVNLPILPQVVASSGSGKLINIISNNYSPAINAAYHAAGATVYAVEAMSIEEIFVASVQQRQQRSQQPKA